MLSTICPPVESEDEPANIFILPPTPMLPLPAKVERAPPAPAEDVEVAITNPPDPPLVAAPEIISRLPVEAETDLGTRSVKEPELVSIPIDVSREEPPVEDIEEPEVMVIRPPAPLLPLAICTLTLPADPLVEYLPVVKKK